MYRGLAAACLRPQALCMFVGNEWSKRAIGGPEGKLSTAGAFFAGAVTGYVEAVSVTPFEVVKIRMQSLDHGGKYKCSSDCVKTIVREEGPLALYNGFWASCWRNCIFNGAYFWFVHQVKESVPLPEPSSGAGVMGVDLAVGMSAGFFATCCKMPFDIAKSRLMNQPTPAPGVVPKFKNTLHCIDQTWRQEGVGALYKGFTPTAMRMVLGTGVAYVAFEAALGVFETDPAGES